MITSAMIALPVTPAGASVVGRMEKKAVLLGKM